MKTSWTAGLNEEQKQRMKEDYQGSIGMRMRLKELLENKKSSIRVSNLSRDAYNSPSWSLLQADGVGYERAMNEIISLIYDEKVEK